MSEQEGTVPVTTSPRVLVIDNGSLSVGALTTRLTALGATTETVSCTELPDDAAERFHALVLSGTKVRAYDSDFYRPLVELVTGSSIPVLGICGGMQIIGTSAGAGLVPGGQRVGAHDVQVDVDEPLFASAPPTVSLFQRHTLYLDAAPPGYRAIGRSEQCPVEFLSSDDGRVLGSQAHLEFRADGAAVLRGFLSVVDEHSTTRAAAGR